MVAAEDPGAGNDWDSGNHIGCMTQWMKAMFGLELCWMTWLDDRTEVDPVDGSVEICRVYAHRLDAGGSELGEGGAGWRWVSEQVSHPHPILTYSS